MAEEKDTAAPAKRTAGKTGRRKKPEADHAARAAPQDKDTGSKAQEILEQARTEPKPEWEVAEQVVLLPLDRLRPFKNHPFKVNDEDELMQDTIDSIDTFNTGESRGREVSHSLNYQKLGKDLATVDELAVLDGGKCILQLRGVRPFLSDKYDITKHPNYKYLSDADKRNEFDIERFLSRRLKPKPDEVYDVYDIDASVMDAGETAGG